MLLLLPLPRYFYAPSLACGACLPAPGSPRCAPQARLADFVKQNIDNMLATRHMKQATTQLEGRRGAGWLTWSESIKGALRSLWWTQLLPCLMSTHCIPSAMKHPASVLRVPSAVKHPCIALYR